MRYLVDSDWIADFLKGRSRAVDLLEALLTDGMAISIVTYAEVLEGIYYGRNPAHHEAMFRRLVRGIDVLGVSRRVAERYARISGQLRSQGLLIPPTRSVYRCHSASASTATGHAQSPALRAYC